LEVDPPVALRAAVAHRALIGFRLPCAGTVAAAPVLDISVPGAHDVIGDRAFAEQPGMVARLGARSPMDCWRRESCPSVSTLLAWPECAWDSHFSLPKVAEADLSADIRPFALLATCHG